MKKIFLFSIFIFLIFATSVVATDRIEINTASLQQLDELTGIGPVLAQRIIDARPYSSVDDLLKVKGIGPKTLQKIKDQGLAYVTGQTQQTTQTTNPTPTSATEPTEATNRQAETTPTIVYPSGVFINEILPNPEGPDGTDEWMVPTIQLTGMANSAYL